MIARESLLFVIAQPNYNSLKNGTISIYILHQYEFRSSIYYIHETNICLQWVMSWRIANHIQISCQSPSWSRVAKLLSLQIYSLDLNEFSYEFSCQKIHLNISLIFLTLSLELAFCVSFHIGNVCWANPTTCIVKLVLFPQPHSILKWIMSISIKSNHHDFKLTQFEVNDSYITLIHN